MCSKKVQYETVLASPQSDPQPRFVLLFVPHFLLKETITPVRIIGVAVIRGRGLFGFKRRLKEAAN